MGNTLRQSIAEGRSVWIDGYQYCAALFGTSVPWLDQAAFSAFHSKMQGLLRSDVVALPVEEVAAALLASEPGLARDMAAKARAAYPLRRLLEDERLRAAVTSLLVVLRAASGSSPLALVIPSPRRWFALAYEAARGEPPSEDVARDIDEIDGASVYVADFLRVFAESGVDILLIAETPGEAPADVEMLEAYQSVFNAARHYRWEIGLLDTGATVPPQRGEYLDAVITRAPDGTGMAGSVVDEAFFDGGDVPAFGTGCFHYVVVPPQARPEGVLERLSELRARTGILHREKR